jgi:mannosyltransferase
MNQFTASLWGDEAWAATLAINPVLEIIKIVARDTSPPLYYLSLHFWMKIFGTSEIAIRSLSFIFFLATAGFVFSIGRYLWDKKTGFLAALLVFTNPFLFTYAFEGRMYALLLLTSTASVYFFLKKRHWPFIFATTAALYTHHFSLFVIFWEAIWRLKENWGKTPRQILKDFSDFLIIGLFYLPWVYPLYYQASLVAGGFWLGKPTLKTFFQTIQKFLVGSEKNNFEEIALISFLAILFFRNWKEKLNISFFLLGWLFTPLVLTFTISQFFQPIFFDRYMLMTIPAACLILASQRRKISNLFLGVVIACLIFNNYYYFTHPTKRPFRELAEYIKKEATWLTLINHNAAAHHLWEAKYYGLKAPIYSPQPLPFYTGTALMTKGDIISHLPEEKEIGVITSAPVEEVNFPGYHLLNFQQFGELKFLWMEKD